MLTIAAPHFLLLTQAHSRNSNPLRRSEGVWRFVLEEFGGHQRIEVTETEPGVWGERLQLLAVVRGLEALEEPARVTLITPSRFVGNGIRSNLANWRRDGWQWEHFGEMIAIKNVDLWKRIDQALKYHQVDCRIWDFGLSLGDKEDGRKSDEIRPAGQRKPVRRKASGPQSESNKITFDEIQGLRLKSEGHEDRDEISCIPIKPIGQGRAFGLCPAS